MPQTQSTKGTQSAGANSQTATCFLLVCCLLAQLAICLALAQQNQDQQRNKNDVPATTKVNWARRVAILTFDQFKRIFRRAYKSAAEETARQHAYVARAIRVFLTRVDYAKGRISYYYAINSLSDVTQQELDHMTNESVDEMIPVDTIGQLEGGQHLRVAESGVSSSKENPTPSGGGDTRHGDEKVYYDLRGASRCLSEPRNQGKTCGACYAFATIALFEWLYCRATGDEPVQFSEQFIVDCGHMTGNNGCNGGNMQASLTFMNKTGVLSLQDYPYEGKLGKCPLVGNYGEQWQTLIGLRKLNPAFGYGASIDNWPNLIKSTPILVALKTRETGLLEYGGGVHVPAQCNSTKADHAMLVVGHGRSDGEDYWLMRNSHGPDWGDKGHYRLSKRSSECISRQLGFVFGFWARKHYHRPTAPASERARVRKARNQNNSRVEWLDFVKNIMRTKL